MKQVDILNVPTAMFDDSHQSSSSSSVAASDHQSAIDRAGIHNIGVADYSAFNF